MPDLLDEISNALNGCEFEVLIVDDASSDGSWNMLCMRAQADSRLRPFRHDQCAGQSTSLWQVAWEARGEWVVTLDGDGQNDPADIPALVARALLGDVDLVAGQRTSRQDDWVKRLSSRVANAVRRVVLGDGTPDTGCGLR